MSVCVYVSLCDFVCLVLLLPFVLGFYLIVLFFFSLPFLLSHVAGRVLVLRPVSGLSLRCGRADFRTLVHERTPSPM